MTFRIIATAEQLQAFEKRCQTTERMFAFTLCQRFQIEATEENLTLVAGWMQSARSMGLANWINCGIQMQRIDPTAAPSLHDIKWLHLGTTDQYDDLKKAIAHVCRDVTNAASINEICLNDILQTFHKHGYQVITRE